jgi:hypothetical protein
MGEFEVAAGGVHRQTDAGLIRLAGEGATMAAPVFEIVNTYKTGLSLILSESYT